MPMPSKDEPESPQSRYNDRPLEPPVMPKIRGENPPRWILDQGKKLRQKIDFISALAWTVAIVGFVFIAGFAMLRMYHSIGFVLLILGACYLAIGSQRKAYANEADILNQPIYLDAFNTEFICPLSNRSTLRITVHFQIPRELNVAIPASSYYASPPPPHIVEQLNRVTEAKLFVYTQQFSEPPDRPRIEDYLREALVQLQDENNISVLRIEVPIIIPIAPGRPRGVNV